MPVAGGRTASAVNDRCTTAPCSDTWCFCLSAGCWLHVAVWRHAAGARSVLTEVLVSCSGHMRETWVSEFWSFQAQVVDVPVNDVIFTMTGSCQRLAAASINYSCTTSAYPRVVQCAYPCLALYAASCSQTFLPQLLCAAGYFVWCVPCFCLSKTPCQGTSAVASKGNVCTQLTSPKPPHVVLFLDTWDWREPPVMSPGPFAAAHSKNHLASCAIMRTTDLHEECALVTWSGMVPLGCLDPWQWGTGPHPWHPDM
jgi:hypothetical protein